MVPMKCCRLFLVPLLFLMTGCAMNQPHLETGFLNRAVHSETTEHLYQVFVPRDYDPAVQWPVILFLHGSGERGHEGSRPTQEGFGETLRWNPERWPAIVVFPQAPYEASWVGTAGKTAMAALHATEAEFSTDPDRIYLTGLSLGGQGTWHLAHEHPGRFAALVPVCGFIDGNGRYPGVMPPAESDPYGVLAAELTDTPIWIFHGTEDPVVPVEGARRMAEALKAVGNDVQFSELPGVGHNAWDPAYSQEELASWIFSQKRRK
jgi:predicted peptidase